MDRAHDTDVQDMLKLVARAIKQLKSKNEEKQTPEIRDILFNPCYLNPGLNEDHSSNEGHSHVETHSINDGDCNAECPSGDDDDHHSDDENHSSDEGHYNNTDVSDDGDSSDDSNSLSKNRQRVEKFKETVRQGARNMADYVQDELIEDVDTLVARAVGFWRNL